MSSPLPKASTSQLQPKDDKQTPSYLRESVGRPKLSLIPPWAAEEEVGWSPTDHVRQRTDSKASQQAKSGDLVALPDTQVTQSSQSHPSHDDAGWWTFTMPSRARDKLEEYRRNHDTEKGHSQHDGLDEKHTTEKMGPDSAFSRKELGDLSTNQAQTPGWSTPWTPFRRQSWTPWNGFDSAHPVEGPDDPRLQKLSLSQRKHNLVERFQNFLLTSPFAPFWLRFLNLFFACATMALAARILYVERANDEEGIIGVSTIFALVLAPLSIIHIMFALWFEYFGAPIGVWSVRSKMLHTLSELIFVATWASELSLSMDAYFTSPARCTSWTPYREYNAQPVAEPGTTEAYLCKVQAGLVSMVFVSLMLYQAVMVVSLFRIYRKVSTRR